MADLPAQARRRILVKECEVSLVPSQAERKTAPKLRIIYSPTHSWINPFSPASHPLPRPRESMDEDSLYQPPSSGSQPSSRRPSAATIISTLLHGVTSVRVSQDGGSGSGAGYTNSEDSSAGSNLIPTQTQANAGHGRRPSALFKAWKNCRGSSSAQQPPAAVPGGGGRRKSSALTRVLPTPIARGVAGVGRVDEHSLASPRTSSNDDTRRRSLSIICRGDRDSDDELDPHQTPRHSNAIAAAAGAGQGERVTAAMAIRDTWLYASHQWTKDGRKGSVSTVATSPSYSQHLPSKRFSGAVVGLDMEEQQIRFKALRAKAGGGDAESVVSLSLTEEIALYTSDVGRRSANSSSSTGQSSRYTPPKRTGWTGGEGGMVWNMPNWSAPPPRLPELSPAPAMMIADPFASVRPMSQVSEGAAASAGMQRVESGSLDPALSPIPASSPSLEIGGGGQGEARGGEGGMQWNTTSPFSPNPLSHRPSMLQEDHSPTAPNFPPSPVSPVAEDTRRRATTYYDASSLLPVVDELPSSPSNHDFYLPRSPRSPKSPKSFGHSEPSYALRRRESYSLPRPPPGYQVNRDSEAQEAAEEEMPTPRLVSMDFSSSSPMSSNFAPETPSNVAATFPEVHGDGFGEGDVTIKPNSEGLGGEGKAEEGDDLHAQFCSVLLLDLGNGTAIPLSPSPGVEARADPFTLLAH